MQNKNSKIITFLAFILRHKPHVAGLRLDDDGWADLNKVILAIDRHKNINTTIEELVEIIKKESRNGFEINEDNSKIRARSGHSILLGFNETNAVPKELYLIVNKNEIPLIFESGLEMKPGKYLMLEKTIEYNSNEKIITINASRAILEKVKFYNKNNNFFFAFHIPSKFISFSI